MSQLPAPFQQLDLVVQSHAEYLTPNIIQIMVNNGKKLFLKADNPFTAKLAQLYIVNIKGYNFTGVHPSLIQQKSDAKDVTICDVDISNLY